MSATLATAPSSSSAAAPTSPLLLTRSQWLAALAVLFVFFAPYQTLVQTTLTDDSVRKGINVDSYNMTWATAGYAVGLLYGAFTGMWLAGRIGARYTIALGMFGFALGALLTGSAVGLTSLVLGRTLDGFGKMMVMSLCRTTLYKQFDKLLLVGIGFYGIFAYATRNATPLIMAELDVELSWRWMYWAQVPIALIGMVLVWRYFRADRPAQPIRLPIDWLAVTLFVAWIVSIVFAFSWYRKWGGWSSNTFAVVAIMCIILPVALVLWLGSGFSPDDHLKRLTRSRPFLLAMITRGLMLTQIAE
jgi:MFS family permease